MKNDCECAVSWSVIKWAEKQKCLETKSTKSITKRNENDTNTNMNMNTNVLEEVDTVDMIFDWQPTKALFWARSTQP